MKERADSDARYASLRATRRVLARMAPLARIGLSMAGVGLFLDRVAPLVADVQLTYGERFVTGIVALVVLGGFGLAAWLVGNLLWASAEMVDVLVDQAEAAGRTADLIEWQVAPTLGRVAVALERVAASSQAPPQDDGRSLAVEGVRRAIASRRWVRAERLLEGLARDYPDAAEAKVLADELALARRATVDELKDLLDEAREAGDPDRVIALRDSLTEHLRGDPLKELDLRVARWLVGVVRDRTRGGAVDPETVALTGRVVDTFADTPEGASLRAALPVLRRKAGLCARCGRPYRGQGPACPQCRARGHAPASSAPESEIDP